MLCSGTGSETSKEKEALRKWISCRREGKDPSSERAISFQSKRVDYTRMPPDFARGDFCELATSFKQGVKGWGVPRSSAWVDL